MTPTGFEPVSTTTDPTRALRQTPSAGAAKSGAILPENTRTDPRLASLIAIWPRLPESTRRAIMEMVSGQEDAKRNVSKEISAELRAVV